MSRLTRDGTAEPVSRDQILRNERGQGSIHFPYPTDHMQDWQPYPFDSLSCYVFDLTYCTSLMWRVCLAIYRAQAAVGSPLLNLTHPDAQSSSCDCQREANGVLGMVRKRLGRVLDTRTGTEIHNPHLFHWWFYFSVQHS